MEDFIVNPRKVDDEFKFSQKHSRLLFFGYSGEIMESTAKAVAIENNWLFTELDSQEILLSFLNGGESDIGEGEGNVRKLFGYARRESGEQKSTYMILIKNVERILRGGEGSL